MQSHSVLFLWRPGRLLVPLVPASVICSLCLPCHSGCNIIKSQSQSIWGQSFGFLENVGVFWGGLSSCTTNVHAHSFAGGALDTSAFKHPLCLLAAGMTPGPGSVSSAILLPTSLFAHSLLPCSAYSFHPFPPAKKKKKMIFFPQISFWSQLVHPLL